MNFFNDVKKVDMFSVGYVTVILYLASITFYLIGVLYPHFFYLGSILGTLFFIISSVIIAVMVKKRINT